MSSRRSARVVDGQRRRAAGAGTYAGGRRRAGQDNEEVSAKAFDLLAHRFVGALPDGDHRDQRGDADEDAEHGECRAHLVAPECDCGGRQCHRRKARPQPAVRRGLRARRASGWSLGRLARVYARTRVSAFVGHDFAIAHRHDAVHIRRDILLVGDDHDRHAVFAIEREQHRHDVVRRARIEIAGRLVGKQHARVADERPCDRYALLLPAGELAAGIALAIG